MSRIVIVAGVHLDRAWPELGRSFGDALRAWSREVLGRVVEEARRREADTLIVLGDLMDRSTVTPETTEYAAAVLGAFPGHVFIAPGVSDWVGDDGPYELGVWPANVHIWTTAGFEPAPGSLSVWGSAWTAPSARDPRLPSREPGTTSRTLFRASLRGYDPAGHDVPDRVVTSGVAAEDSMLIVEDLVHAPGESGGRVLVLDDEGEGAVEPVELAGQPGSLVLLDVTALGTPGDLADAIQEAALRDGPVLLRLSGQLPAQILLPGFGGTKVPPGLVLGTDGLGYAAEVPDAADRSTRAEFLRAMALTRGDERERHQTTALGLEALSASATGA